MSIVPYTSVLSGPPGLFGKTFRREVRLLFEQLGPGDLVAFEIGEAGSKFEDREIACFGRGGEPEFIEWCNSHANDFTHGMYSHAAVSLLPANFDPNVEESRGKHYTRTYTTLVEKKLLPNLVAQS